jgi:LysM repeat protein
MICMLGYRILQRFICKYRYILLFFFVFTFLFASEGLPGQTKVEYVNYINKYSRLAVEHMKKYNIPASVTLAQGILESGAGTGDLALRSNNHFGIKCHRGWSGPTVYAQDDLPNDCFRKYKNVEESYNDHSDFLLSSSRYSSLFQLPITDYKGWARGLQRSGYATDKTYANKLIRIIEDYELYRFDNKKEKGRTSTGSSREKGKSKEREEARPVRMKRQAYITHGLVYVEAVDGDTFESIAEEFGFNEKDLLKYNEVSEGFPLSRGNFVYFQKKKTRADKFYSFHTVQVGESMYMISQKYGIQLRNLYRLNKKSYEYIPAEGDVLKLR